MWDQMSDASSSPVWEVEFDMGILIPFEPLENVLLRSAENVMDLVDLVEFVLAREEWEEAQDFEEDAANSPHIHLVVVVALGQQTLRRPVPPGRDILGVALALHALAGAEIDQLYFLVLQQDILPRTWSDSVAGWWLDTA